MNFVSLKRLERKEISKISYLKKSFDTAICDAQDFPGAINFS